MKTKDKIIIDSSTENLHIIRDFIGKHLSEIKVEQNIQNQILVSIDEACTNIIKHTYKYNKNHKIDVELECDSNKCVIILTYNGEGFDPTQKDNPDMKEYFAKFKVGGLGIPLMKKSMDSIEFQHIQPDINLLKLTKILSL